jgi:uncharacterized tellurite resistance protein B-like protein
LQNVLELEAAHLRTHGLCCLLLLARGTQFVRNAVTGRIRDVPMLARLQNLIRAFTPGSQARPRYVFDEADHRVAAAGLLIYAMNVDGVQSPAEKQRVEALLRERFSLDEEETHALITAAGERNRDALDFNDFTGVVKRAYSLDGRQRIIEMMWEIAFADRALHEFEDNLVWRVAETLGVPAHESVAIRKKVAAHNNVALSEANE